MSYPQTTPPGRFGITNVESGPDSYAATMPLNGLLNPITGAPSLAPLAVLVDHIAGFANHDRRPVDHWTVSSELAMEFAAGAQQALATDPSAPVLAVSRPVGAAGDTSLSVCTLTHRGAEIGLATVRTFYITAAVHVPGAFEQPVEPPQALPTTLGELMAVEEAESGGTGVVLRQHQHPAINNTLGAVHGGVAAAGLELVASAALNTDRTGAPLLTASVRVNYLRPLTGGGHAHYTATPLHLGRRSGVAEARGIGDDGKVALTARVTGYR
ncbi:PaaI family thioesterase [Mycobacterium sp. MBM]|nr:PaaI family thioesterase [Mycobacterium sp. MBM]